MNISMTLLEEGRVIQRRRSIIMMKSCMKVKEIICRIFLHKINDYPEEFYDENELERLLDDFQDKLWYCLFNKTKRSNRILFKISNDDFNRRTRNWENNSC